MILLKTIGQVLLAIIIIGTIIIYIFSFKNPNDTYITYVHEDTKSFSYEFDFDSKNIKKYTYRDIVFVPHFRYIGGSRNNETYQFYFQIFSKVKKSIIINAINLGKIHRVYNTKININEPKKAKFLGMFWTKLLLFSNITPYIKVSEENLATFINKNGDIEVSIMVTIDKQIKSLVFKIKPTEETSDSSVLIM